MKFNVPELGDLTPKRGSWIIKSVSRTILRLAGWKVKGKIPNIRKAVFIGAPHTSNWDFPIAITTLFAIGIRLSWMGKHTFVNGFFKPLWHYLDGIPIDRRASHGVVGEMIAQFNGRSHLLLGLAPEGTRSKVKRWKMGFYYIAHGANVPICPVSIDYGRKVINFGDLIMPDNNLEAVLTQLQDFYNASMAKHPQNFVPILPK
jgi:1-acyl-sn-glycerol-3-phosphate acyltransferase